MKFEDYIHSAYINVKSNKARTFLTILGIIIGISAVMVIANVGNGFKKYINNQFSDIGANNIYFMENYKNANQNRYHPLTMEDLSLLRQADEVNYVAPYVTVNYDENGLKTDNPNLKIRFSLIGTDKDFQNVSKVTMIKGRFIQDVHLENNLHAVVVDEKFAKKYFGTTDIINEKILLKYDQAFEVFTIIGVYKSREAGGISFSFNDMGTTAYIPYTTAMNIKGNQHFDYFIVNVNSSYVAKTANNLLNYMNTAKQLSYNAYESMQFEDIIKQSNNVINIFTIFLSLVAAISLLVGGVGIMNIMLVSVTERTNEIGIRKSLGATDSNIERQFIFEASFLTLLGGLLGIVVGYVLSIAFGSLLSNMMQFEMTVPFSIVNAMIAAIFSLVIGLIFGVYPAKNAARLDPIEALRHEK